MPVITPLIMFFSGLTKTVQAVSETVKAPKKARHEQERLLESQIAEQEGARKKQEEKEAADEATVSANLARDRQRLRARRAGSSDRGGTIATSPVGVVGSPLVGQKTAIGL